MDLLSLSTSSCWPRRRRRGGCWMRYPSARAHLRRGGGGLSPAGRQQLVTGTEEQAGSHGRRAGSGERRRRDLPTWNAPAGLHRRGRARARAPDETRAYKFGEDVTCRPARSLRTQRRNKGAFKWPGDWRFRDRATDLCARWWRRHQPLDDPYGEAGSRGKKGRCPDEGSRTSTEDHLSVILFGAAPSRWG